MIRTNPCPIAAPDKSPSDEIIYNTSHTGRAFDTDNKEVHRILDELTLGTVAADLIKTYLHHHDSRAAWIALFEHYDGPAEGEKRVTVSRANIDQAFYKNESTFSFERYTARIKQKFDTLPQYNQPKSNLEEVGILLKQINKNNTQLTACIQICRHSYSANFNDAATYLSTQIAQNVAKAQTRNGKKIFNGVDITHKERYFPAKEWAQLGPQGQKVLNDCPKLKAKKEAFMSRNKNKVSSESTQNGKQK